MKTSNNSFNKCKNTTTKLFDFRLTCQCYEYIYTECLKVTLDEFKDKWMSYLHSERKVLHASVTLGDKNYCFEDYSELLKRIEEHMLFLMPKSKHAA